MSPRSKKGKKRKILPVDRRVPKRNISFNVDTELRKALQHHQSGQLKMAERIYDKILKVNPNHSDALHLRGFIAHQVGKNDIAVNYINEAIQNDPNNPIYYYNLALPFTEQGRLNEAISCYEKALKLKPDFVEACVNMGNIFQEQGRLNEAISCYEKALKLKPDDFRAYNNMGTALKGQGKFDEAISCYEKALKLKPDYADVYYDMGNAFEAQGKLNQATACYQKSLQLKPDDAETYNNMGTAFEHQGRLNEAISCYEKALKLKPDYIDAHNNMGTAFKYQGKFDEAISCYEKALKLKPNCAETFYLLARAKKTTYQDTKELFRLVDELNNNQIEEDGLIYMNFALGKIHDDLGMFEKAFTYYQLGNKQEREKHEFNPGSHKEYMSRIIQTFSNDFCHNKDSWGSDSEMPIFIVGMPRSGTTLVEQIISSHPDVLGGGELDFFFQLESRLRLGHQVHSPYPEYVKWITDETARNISESYIRHIRNLTESSRNQSRVTDKMPGNYLYLGLMFLLFPRARFIHCRRHPLDNCLSIYFQRFSQPHHYAYDLTEIGLSYLEYQRLMAHWRKVSPIIILEVKYEELVHQQEEISRKLLEFCGLEWDSRCLNFYKNDRPVFTGSNWQVRQPMYTSSVGRWKNYDPFLGPLKELLAELL